MTVQVVNERIIQMVKGELTGRSFIWIEILQGLCNEYKVCYHKATEEGRKIVQIGFSIVWAE